MSEHDSRVLKLADKLLTPVGLKACHLASCGLSALAPATAGYTDAQIRAKIRTAYQAAGITLQLTSPSIALTGSPWSVAVPIDHA